MPLSADINLRRPKFTHLFPFTRKIRSSFLHCILVYDKLLAWTSKTMQAVENILFIRKTWKSA